MEKALNPNTNLETMPTGTYPNGKADNIAFQNQYGVLLVKRTGEAVNVTVELQDGEVVMNRTIQLCR